MINIAAFGLDHPMSAVCIPYPNISDDGLDYDALMMSDDDSLIGGGAGGEGATAAEPTDAEMERLLLDNLSSGSELEIDGSDQEEEKGPPRKKRKNK